MKEAPETESDAPETLLWRALRAEGPDRRLEYAEAALARSGEELEPDTHVLLLRQAYLAHLELHQLRRASELALEMAEIGPLSDIGYHDAARALAAIGDTGGAIESQRLATRHAPPERRSFHHWSLATLQHWRGDHDGALATLERSLRWAAQDRPLLEAHAAYVRLDRGEMPEGLDETLHALQQAKCGEGYGQFVLGMIRYLMGDLGHAAAHLRAFLHRNAGADAAKALTLREELRRARLTLATLEST